MSRNPPIKNKLFLKNLNGNYIIYLIFYRGLFLKKSEIVYYNYKLVNLKIHQIVFIIYDALWIKKYHFINA